MKALKLSLELGHKGDFVSTFKNYVNSIINTKLNTENVKKSDIDLIIENRKIINKEVPEVDLNAKVLNCKNLYAVGEVSCFGLHGANRLASNSLLEGLVFSKIAVETSLKDDFKIDLKNYTKKEILYTKTKPIDKNIKDSLRRIMWDSAGIIREKSELKKALEKLKFKERHILIERYLVGKTQIELAEEIGISQAQISRLEKSGLENIKKMIS